MKLAYILAICDFLVIFGLTVSALYVVILVGYIVKMSLRWDIVTAIFPRPFVSGLVASMAYVLRKHLSRMPLSEVKLIPEIVVPKKISATLKDKPRELYQQILACLQTRPQEPQKIKPSEVKKTSAKLSEVEEKISELLDKGKSVYEIGLRLSMDSMQVKETIATLAKKKSSIPGFKRTETELKKDE